MYATVSVYVHTNPYIHKIRNKISNFTILMSKFLWPSTQLHKLEKLRMTFILAFLSRPVGSWNTKTSLTWNTAYMVRNTIETLMGFSDIILLCCLCTALVAMQYSNGRLGMLLMFYGAEVSHVAKNLLKSSWLIA